MKQPDKETSHNWWPAFQKHSLAFEKRGNLPPAIVAELETTTRLFLLFKEDKNEFRTIPPSEIQTWIKKAEELRRNLLQLTKQSKKQNAIRFYQSFAQSIQSGLKELNNALFPSNIIRSGNGAQESPLISEPEITQYKANEFADKLYELKKAYLPIMEARHEEQKKKGSANTVAEESDRVESFLAVAEYWIKHLYALEYAFDLLKHNLQTKNQAVVKEPLPLQFRLERNKPNYTLRLFKASLQKPTSEDITILDIINGCYQVPIVKREGKILVDNSDVIRFIRLHSVKDDLLNFKTDQLSQIGNKMYEALLKMILETKSHTPKVIGLINKTPIQDMERAFAGINPEECRNLLRLKFQSTLPGINEDHYRKSEGKAPGKRSSRTIEIMEEYARNYRKSKKVYLDSLKPTLAMAYWLRKMLISVIRSNQVSKDKSSEKKSSSATEAANPNNGKSDHHMMVGISYTIGEEDFSNFYIDPDDIIGSDMSIQRVDRTDKWIAVRKSDKLHRIRKVDFFHVIQEFIETDLNKSLKKFGLAELNMKRQLLPEIQERLGDIERIDTLRSGVLGTTLTNLEEFRTAAKFHSTLRRYFKKAEYDNMNYPADEKRRKLAVEISNANTSILQMKYRRVLRIIDELNTGENTDNETSKPDSLPSTDADKNQRITPDHICLRNIKKIQEIMVFAKPALKDVKMETDNDVVVFKNDA